MSKGLEMEDFYRKLVTVRTESDLFNLYKTFESQRIEHSRLKLSLMGGDAPEMEPDDYSDWLIRRGVCPHSIITDNSRYHFENSVLLDGEMGLKLPNGSESIGDTPSIFFQAISIVRQERTKVREEEKEKNA
jgi:hypothetical protein